MIIAQLVGRKLAMAEAKGLPTTNTAVLLVSEGGQNCVTLRGNIATISEKTVEATSKTGVAASS